MDPVPSTKAPRRRLTAPWAAVAVVVVVALIAAGIPAMQLRSYQMGRVRCQTNLRRLSMALLLYAQDHDYRFPPPDYRTPAGGYRTWVDLLRMYIDRQRILECPWNPVGDGKHKQKGFTFRCSYALNARFWGHFLPGPFPIENVEMPGGTVLLVEAGLRRTGSPFEPAAPPWITHTYWDTGADPLAYPSPHNRRMNIVALDGHIQTIFVAHYGPANHDAEYGHLGGGVFNWNGGFPNGDTSGAPRE
ncbi:MAG: hypothetical protein FJX72_20775 [Armatimonadetes bacterium]|nr:hypothetical protein [Armatimonadota bacterium]